MLRRLATLVLIVLVSMCLTGVSAAAKILAVATTAPDLMETFLTNAGETADSYKIVQTVTELKQEWANRDKYSILTFAYHEIMNNPAVGAFIKEHKDELVEWVKNGGNVFATTRDDPADNVLLSAFGLSYSGLGSYNTQTFDIVDKDHPVFTLVGSIDTKKMEKEISICPDPSYVDSGLKANDKFAVIATMPNSKDPAILAGSVGKGKVVFAGVEFFWKDYTEVSQNILLIRNIIAWFRQAD